MLTPEVAAVVLGLEYSQSEDLACQPFTYRDQKFKTAGLLDRQRKAITVATDSLEIMRFTGAHEIGHWILHPNEIIHRDRPINTNYARKYHRPKIEKEADYFAACFLMPRNLLINYFTSQFQCGSQFILNENSAFHLVPSDPYQLLDAPIESLDRELALAGCTSFNGHKFGSSPNRVGRFHLIPSG